MYPLVILCGGKAKRLGSLASEVPKSLIEINKKPFLSYILENYIDQGIKDIYFCLGHLSEKFEEYIETSSKAEVNFYKSYDDKLFNGTGGAVKKVAKKISGPFFVTYGDSYLDINLKKILKSYKMGNGPLMTIFKNNGQFDNSNCMLTDERIIYSKSQTLEGANYIDYGLSIFASEDFLYAPNSFDLSSLQEKYSLENKLQYYEVRKRFYEIGNLEGLKEFDEHIRKIWKFFPR